MPFIFSCFFFPFPLLLAQVRGSQQVPEAWVLARRQSLLQIFLASLETTVNSTLLASTHSTCSIPQSWVPALLDGGFRESLSRTKAGTGPVVPHLPAETNSTILLQPSNLRSKCSFSRGLSDKESTCPCRRHGFDPRSGKIPHATRQPSQCSTTTEPVIYSPGATAIRGLCAPQLESSPPLTPTREKPTQQQRPSTAKNK